MDFAGRESVWLSEDIVDFLLDGLGLLFDFLPQLDGGGVEGL